MNAPVTEVDTDRLMASCQTFARYVKLSGTPPELESLATIRAQLDEAGYRTTLLLHDAYISLPGPARVTVDDRPLRAITHSFSRPSTGLTAPIVDLGAGTEADFARPDLHGAILLLDGIANPAAAARAARAGAAGQLHVSPHDHLHEMCISPVWGSPGADTLAELPQTVTCTISQIDGTALRARLAAGKPPQVTLAAEVDTGWRPTPILVADLDGPTPDCPLILLSGHHDTWFYGVMDNGGANATMVECARILARHRVQWRRALRVCFWSGHSHGRYSGSAWYADNHWAELDRRCAAHVNVDSTGAIDATVLTDSGTAEELAHLAADAVRAETGQAHAGHRNSRNSDMSFWGIGIPAMFGSVSHQPPAPVAMRNPLGWWWHTPEDLLDKIDPAHLTRDTAIVLRALWRLLTDEALPLDLAAHADALLRELATTATTLGDRLDLTPLTDAAQALRTAAAAPATDAALMRAARALVPAAYTAGDRFRHDQALNQSPWPVLDPIRRLAAAAPGDPERFARTDATRARNRLLHALTTATQALSRS